MKILIISQNSELSSKISESSKQVEKGYYIWDDTGKTVDFPILSTNKRKKTWIPEKTYFDISFSELEREFPKNVAIVVPSASPFLGEAWYNEENDNLVLYKENWDSSD